MPNTSPAILHSITGQEFLVYQGPDESVFLERVRSSGKRDSKSIFQFSAKALAVAIAPVAAAVVLLLNTLNTSVAEVALSPVLMALDFMQDVIC